MKLIVICICLMDGCHLWNLVNLGDELSSSTFSNGASTDWFRFSSPCHTVLSSPTVKWINSFPVGIAKVSLHSVSCAKGQPFPSSCWPRVHCGLRSSSNSGCTTPWDQQEDKIRWATSFMCLGRTGNDGGAAVVPPDGSGAFQGRSCPWPV